MCCWSSVITWISSCWLGVFVSDSSAFREGRCEKVGRDRKEPSSSPSLIRNSTELATEIQEDQNQSTAVHTSSVSVKTLRWQNPNKHGQFHFYAKYSKRIFIYKIIYSGPHIWLETSWTSEVRRPEQSQTKCDYLPFLCIIGYHGDVTRSHLIATFSHTHIHAQYHYVLTRQDWTFIKTHLIQQGAPLTTVSNHQ